MRKAFSVSLVLLSLSFYGSRAIANDEITLEGKLFVSTIEGGFWALTTNDKETYDLGNLPKDWPYLPKEWPRHGGLVRITGRVSNSEMSFHMSGPELVVSKIERISGPLWISPADAQYGIFEDLLKNSDAKNAYQQFIVFRSSFSTDPRINNACEKFYERFQGFDEPNVNFENHLITECPDIEASYISRLRQRGEDLFRKKDYVTAQKCFQRILSSPRYKMNPPVFGSFTRKIPFENADCYFKLGDMSNAASAYKTFYVGFPDDSEAPRAMALEVVSLSKANRCAEASQAYIRHEIRIILDDDVQQALTACHYDFRKGTI